MTGVLKYMLDFGGGRGKISIKLAAFMVANTMCSPRNVWFGAVVVTAITAHFYSENNFLLFVELKHSRLYSSDKSFLS